jgi:hypothetical protein
LCGKYCQCGHGKCPLAGHNYIECVQIKAERKHFCRSLFFFCAYFERVEEKFTDHFLILPVGAE